MKFTWDPAQAEANLGKHAVAFDEATSVFGDPLAATRVDAKRTAEERFITMGLTSAGRLIVVVHADHEEVIRIISARPPTAHEQRQYEEGKDPGARRRGHAPGVRLHRRRPR